MHRIRKIDIPTLAIYSFVMILVVMYVLAVPIGLLSNAFTGMMMSEMPNAPEIPKFFSTTMMLILPPIYAAFGTIANVLGGLLYNLISRKMGGIKMMLEPVD